MPNGSLFPKHRLDALVDAVIAITMTLLVLELRVPDELSEGFLAAVQELEPKFISWVISFLILAVFWRGHMRMTRGVGHIDSRLFWIVILWLLLTSLVPFTSSLIGQHNEIVFSHFAYGANLIVVEILVVARDVYLSRHPELFSDAKECRPARILRLLPVSICALASMGLALVWTSHASLAYLLVLPMSPWLSRDEKPGI